MVRPITTLFMLMSLDGKISTGVGDKRDFDADLPRVEGAREGLHQYYEIEKGTDEWSLCTGKTQAKIGVNLKDTGEKKPVSFCIVDNNWLTEKGVRYLCSTTKRLVLVTCNKEHPAFAVKEDNLSVILQDRYNLKSVLRTLKEGFSCDRLTIQSGGTLNSIFVRDGLIDYVDVVIAPIVVGGSSTPTLVDGPSILHSRDLDKIGVLEFLSFEVLDRDYIRLCYKFKR